MNTSIRHFLLVLHVSLLSVACTAESENNQNDAEPAATVSSNSLADLNNAGQANTDASQADEEKEFEMPHSDPSDPLISDSLQREETVYKDSVKFTVRISRVPTRRIVSTGPYIKYGDTLRQYYQDNVSRVQILRRDSTVYSKEFGIDVLERDSLLPADNFLFGSSSLEGKGDTLQFEHGACVPDTDWCRFTTTKVALP